MNLLNFPYETTMVILLAATSLALALLTLLILLLSRIRRMIRKVRFKHIRYISVAEHIFQFTLTFLWIAVSAAILFLAAFVQSYQRFTKEELVAEVRCVPLADDTDSMFLELTPIVNGKQLSAREFLLKGDQWALEGDILKWDNWLNFAGLHTMYKLTRVRGRYVDYQDEVSRQPSIYSLVEHENDPRWRWLYKYGHRLRFVDAVYGNTVYTYPSENNIFEVYVSTTGYVVKVKE